MVGHCTRLIQFKSVKAFICLVTTKFQTVQHIPQKEAATSQFSFMRVLVYQHSQLLGLGSRQGFTLRFMIVLVMQHSQLLGFGIRLGFTLRFMIVLVCQRSQLLGLGRSTWFHSLSFYIHSQFIFTLSL